MSYILRAFLHAFAESWQAAAQASIPCRFSARSGGPARRNSTGDTADVDPNLTGFTNVRAQGPSRAQGRRRATRISSKPMPLTVSSSPALITTVVVSGSMMVLQPVRAEGRRFRQLRHLARYRGMPPLRNSDSHSSMQQMRARRLARGYSDACGSASVLLICSARSSSASVMSAIELGSASLPVKRTMKKDRPLIQVNTDFPIGSIHKPCDQLWLELCEHAFGCQPSSFCCLESSP